MDGATQPQKSIALGKMFDMPMEVPLVEWSNPAMGRFVEYLQNEMPRLVAARMRGEIYTLTPPLPPVSCLSCGNPLVGQKSRVVMGPFGLSLAHTTCVETNQTVQVLV